MGSVLLNTGNKIAVRIMTLKTIKPNLNFPDLKAVFKMYPILTDLLLLSEPDTRVDDTANNINKVIGCQDHNRNYQSTG